jgi:YaaC-like Protein
VEERPQLADFLVRYPALQGWRRRPPTGPEIGWPKRDNHLSLQWELTECEKRSKHVVGDRLSCYRGHRMAFPTAQGRAAPLYPLMVWWAVLYALSMLSSYSTLRWPRCQISWTKQSSVSRSVSRHQWTAARSYR